MGKMTKWLKRRHFTRALHAHDWGGRQGALVLVMDENFKVRSQNKHTCLHRGVQRVEVIAWGGGGYFCH